jgi:hypothetical protein
MALPTQEIEKIVRGPVGSQGSYKQLLLLSGSLLVISLIFYFGLTLGYEPYLQGQVTFLDSQILDFAKQVPAAEQTKLISFYSQLVNLKTLLSRHPSTSNIFPWLEKNTQENSYFTKFGFNAATYQISLVGVSKTTTDAAMQAAVLESQPEVSRMNLNNLAASPTGGWQFNITLFMDPNFFGVIGTVPFVAPAPASTSTAQAATSSRPSSGLPVSTSTKQ